MNRKLLFGLVPFTAVFVFYLTMTALAKKPPKPPSGPPTPGVTPGMVLINATATSGDLSGDSYVDPYGNIMLCGWTAEGATYISMLARITPDGLLDASFGAGGVVTNPIEDISSAAACGAQSGGRIITVGSARKSGRLNDIAIAGYLYDGSPNKFIGDPRGRRGGDVTTDIDGDIDGAGDGAIQADDKIVVVGAARIDGVHTLFAMRYTEDAFVDTSYGTDGFYFFPGADPSSASCVAIHGDGVVVGGLFGYGFDQAVLLRLDSYGAVDSDFGSSGYVIPDIPNFFVPEFADVAVDFDGTIVAAGSLWSQTLGMPVLVARYDEFGVPDSTFGGGTGYAILEFNDKFGVPELASSVKAVAIQPLDGKIVVAGSTDGPAVDGHQFVARFNYDGSIDTSFGQFDSETGLKTGWVRTEIEDSSSAFSISIQADGKIVTTGEATASGRRMATVVRYNSDGSLDTSFND